MSCRTWWRARRSARSTAAPSRSTPRTQPTGYPTTPAWARIRRDDVFPDGLIAQARMLQRSRAHLFPNTGLAAVISHFVGAARTFADLALPFAAVTLNVATARPHVVRDGPLLPPALLASAAIPGMYPPVDHDSLRLYHGGLVANVLLRQAVGMGARSLGPHPGGRAAPGAATAGGAAGGAGKSRGMVPRGMA